MRLHPGHAHRHGGRALRRRAPGHPDQERRRHRSSPRRSTRSSSTRPARSPPANWPSAAWRRSATSSPPNCCAWPPRPRNTAIIRPPRRWRNLAGEAGVPLAEPKDFAETAGRGVKAEVDGANVLVGRAQWLKDNGVTGDFVKSVDLNETEGWSLIFVARDGQCIGWVGLAGPDPRRGPRSARRAEGERRAAHRDGLRRPPAGGHPRGAAKSAARKPGANACRRTRWSLSAA